MDETKETTAADSALDEAAAEVVEAEEQTTQETEQTTEETTEQVAETEEKPVEELEPEIPSDHKERSNLGRKYSALHRRIDEVDNQFGQIMSRLDSLTQPQEESPVDKLEPDEPITRRDAEDIWEAKDQNKTSKQQSYNENYVRTVTTLGPDLSDADYKGVVAEMENFRYDPTDNSEIDATLNFAKAEAMYFKKKSAQPLEKVNPLKGEKPSEKLGVATTQKTVVKEAAKPKLDSDAQSYIDHVRRRSGDEAADKLLKE